MPGKAKKITCNPEMLQQLHALSRSRKGEFRLVERARMVLACLDGEPIHEIANRLQKSAHTVTYWRNRFAQCGICGLGDMPRSGRPAQYTAEFRASVLQLLDTPPPNGQPCWNGVAVAKSLRVSYDAVWRLLRDEGIRLDQKRPKNPDLEWAQA